MIGSSVDVAPLSKAVSLGWVVNYQRLQKLKNKYCEKLIFDNGASKKILSKYINRTDVPILPVSL